MSHKLNDPATDALESLRRERRMNQLSVQMSRFHEHFKSQFNMLYQLADGSFEKHGLTLPDFLREAQDLITHLTMHHTIEERHLFPILGKKMPKFAQQHDGEHLESHKQIHDGLDSLEGLLKNWSSNPSSYSPASLRECLDGFREVLFRHLDDEVADLRSENLGKYFTFEEVEKFPF